jgi:DNA-binding response OmpR family regulator
MTNQKNQILVVDDDPGIRELLERYLGEQGYEVASVENGEALDHYLTQNHTDLIILDLMLPGEDGLSIAQRLHAQNDAAILMLSARGEDVDRIVGLEVGADDYLAKPFNPRELLARMRAILRRKTDTSEKSKTHKNDQIYKFGSFQLDKVAQELTRNEEVVPLSTGEYALLKIFVDHPGRVMSRDTLIDMLKGYERLPFDRSIDVRVTRLRRKIEDDVASPVYIRTVWGEGYRFTPGDK